MDEEVVRRAVLVGAPRRRGELDGRSGPTACSRRPTRGSSRRTTGRCCVRERGSRPAASRTTCTPSSPRTPAARAGHPPGVSRLSGEVSARNCVTSARRGQDACGIQVGAADELRVGAEARRPDAQAPAASPARGRRTRCVAPLRRYTPGGTSFGYGERTRARATEVRNPTDHGRLAVPAHLQLSRCRPPARRSASAEPYLRPARHVLARAVGVLRLDAQLAARRRGATSRRPA